MHRRIVHVVVPLSRRFGDHPPSPIEPIMQLAESGSMRHHGVFDAGNGTAHPLARVQGTSCSVLLHSGEMSAGPDPYSAATKSPPTRWQPIAQAWLP